MRWGEAQNAELKRQWIENGGSIRRVAKAMGLSRGTIDGASRRLGLQFTGRQTKVAKYGHHETLFPSKVRAPDNFVLKPGSYQRKLGARVAKGKWKGMPIYCLTLEERATCPRSCEQYETCYGNSMHFATRYRHGTALETEIEREVAHLAEGHRQGFVVRLHILGDFYSVSYVVLWSRLLLKHPQLHVFGYTHWKRGTPIGDAIAKLRDGWWDRFAIRTSDGVGEGPYTIVIDSHAERGDAIICPAETGLGRTCSSCSLCWASKKPVAFLRH